MELDGIGIRAAEACDVPVLAAMIAELFSIEEDFTPAPEKHEAGLRALLARADEAAVFAAVDSADGKAIGMVTVQLTVSTAEGGLSGLLEDLFVRGAYRRRGVASALVGAVEAWCASKGVHRVQLLADSTNVQALRFYDAQGYGRTRLACRRRFIE